MAARASRVDGEFAATKSTKTSTSSVGARCALKTRVSQRIRRQNTSLRPASQKNTMASHLQRVKEVTAFVEAMEAAPDPYKQLVIEPVTAVDDALVAAFRKLTPQLSKTSEAPDADALRKILAHDAVTLVAARAAYGVVGVLTL